MKKRAVIIIVILTVLMTTTYFLVISNNNSREYLKSFKNVSSYLEIRLENSFLKLFKYSLELLFDMTRKYVVVINTVNITMIMTARFFIFCLSISLAANSTFLRFSLTSLSLSLSYYKI
jgi:hypothetical protein